MGDFSQLNGHFNKIVSMDRNNSRYLIALQSSSRISRVVNRIEIIQQNYLRLDLLNFLKNSRHFSWILIKLVGREAELINLGAEDDD